MNQIVKNLHKLFHIAMIVTGVIYSSQLSAQITAKGSCAGVTENNEYVVNVAGLSSDITYTIYINNVLDTNNVTGITSFTSSKQSFVSGTRTILARIIESPGGMSADTTDIIVHEVLCIDADNDGDLDFNEASCDYTQPLPTNGTIVSTVAPYNTDNVYLYVLTDSDGVVANPIVSSYSGHFKGLANGEYKVYAYNFLDSSDAAVYRMDSLMAGSDLDDFMMGSAPICYMFCGSASYTIDCACPVVIDTQADNIALCVDDSGEMIIAASTSVSDSVAMLPNPNILEYQWQVDTAGMGVFVDVADTDSILNLNNVTYSMDGNIYRVIVTLDVNGTNICSDTSDTKVLTVYPEPFLLTNLSATVCSDEPSGIELLLDGSNPAVADSFDIISITPEAGLVAGTMASLGITHDSLVIAADTWMNTTGAAANVEYMVAPISTYGCTGDTISIILTVNPEPLFTGNLDITVCSDDIHGVILPTAVSAELNIAVDSFVVAAVVGSNLTGTASIGSTKDANFIAADVFNNVSDVSDTVTYTITPFANGCVGSNFTIKVAVKPEPVFTGDLDEVICSDDITNVMLPATDDTGLSIDSFTISAVKGPALTGTPTEGMGITDVNALANDSFENISADIDSVVYTLTPYTMGCVGSDFTITVRVRPEPDGRDSTLTVCSDEAILVDLQSLINNGLSNVTFEWYALPNSNVSGENITSTFSSTIMDTVNNVTSGDETVTYKIIPTSAVADGSCTGDTMTITVTVRPEPEYEDEEITECSDVALDIDLTDNMIRGSNADGFIYTVVSSDQTNVPAGPARTDTTLANITDTYTNLTGSPVTITYTVTPISVDACAGNTFTVTVTIDPEPILADNLDLTLCSNTVVGVTLTTTAGSVAADSFDIVSIIKGDSITTVSSITTGKYDDQAIASDQWKNTSSVTDSVVYRIIPISAEGCFGDTVNVVITIDPEVLLEAGMMTTICSTVDVILADLSPSISGGTTLGTWSSSGTGTFDTDNTFANATRYIPSAADKANGGVILTLTSADPDGACGPVDDTVQIIINSVECSTFPWNGGE